MGVPADLNISLTPPTGERAEYRHPARRQGHPGPRAADAVRDREPHRCQQRD
jgi:hypothetical protein